MKKVVKLTKLSSISGGLERKDEGKGGVFDRFPIRSVFEEEEENNRWSLSAKKKKKRRTIFQRKESKKGEKRNNRRKVEMLLGRDTGKR